MFPRLSPRMAHTMNRIREARDARMQRNLADQQAKQGACLDLLRRAIENLETSYSRSQNQYRACSPAVRRDSKLVDSYYRIEAAEAFGDSPIKATSLDQEMDRLRIVEGRALELYWHTDSAEFWAVMERAEGLLPKVRSDMHHLREVVDAFMDAEHCHYASEANDPVATGAVVESTAHTGSKRRRSEGSTCVVNPEAAVFTPARQRDEEADVSTWMGNPEAAVFTPSRQRRVHGLEHELARREKDSEEQGEVEAQGDLQSREGNTRSQYLGYVVGTTELEQRAQGDLAGAKENTEEEVDQPQ